MRGTFRVDYCKTKDNPDLSEDIVVYQTFTYFLFAQ